MCTGSGEPEDPASIPPSAQGCQRTFDLSGSQGQQSPGQERAKSEMGQSGVAQSVILQTYRCFRHLARPPEIVINFGIDIIFQIKIKHTQPCYLLPR